MRSLDESIDYYLSLSKLDITGNDECLQLAVWLQELKDLRELHPPKIEEKPLQLFDNYIPTCPLGYDDCICDPAYIKFNYPERYQNLYGDISPEQASKKCEKLIIENNSVCKSYNNEDK